MSQPLPLSQPAPTTPPPKKKGNTLAIWGLVLSCLFFLPLVPTVGLILGIVTLATGRNKTMGIVAVCLGSFFTLFIGIEAAVAIPAFMKYVRRSKTIEATMNTRLIATRLTTLSAGQWAALADADWTPRDGACGYPNQRHPVDGSAWKAAPWSTINFSVDDPSYYQYRIARDEHGFVVEARGDLDCDGVPSHFVRHVTPEGVGQLESENDLE